MPEEINLRSRLLQRVARNMRFEKILTAWNNPRNRRVVRGGKKSVEWRRRSDLLYARGQDSAAYVVRGEEMRRRLHLEMDASFLLVSLRLQPCAQPPRKPFQWISDWWCGFRQMQEKSKEKQGIIILMGKVLGEADFKRFTKTHRIINIKKEPH